MPRNIVMASTAMMTIVAAALRASGGLNAGTPFDTASTPVMAVHPFENALSSSRSETGWPSERIGSIGVNRFNAARHGPPRSNRNQREHADDEKIRRSGEDISRLANPAKVAEHQDHQESQGELHAEIDPRQGTPMSGRRHLRRC